MWPGISCVCGTRRNNKIKRRVADAIIYIPKLIYNLLSIHLEVYALLDNCIIDKRHVEFVKYYGFNILCEIKSRAPLTVC